MYVSIYLDVCACILYVMKYEVLIRWLLPVPVII